MDTAEKVSAILAVLIVIGCFALLILGQPIPDFLTSGFGLVLGFFFGNTTAAARARAR